jgi:hypothetical protein
MGQEISRAQFRQRDFRRFMARVAAETDLLSSWMARGACDDRSYVMGFELEAWLLDHNFFPYPINAQYLERLASPLVVPELSRFNVELNGTPQRLGAGAFAAMERELADTWDACQRTAHDLEGTLVAIGILPTIRETDLTLANISPLKRYAALNAQVTAARGGRPLAVDIAGREHLRTLHDDVMLEAATTSFQVHLQVPASQLARHYNASIALAGPMVAASANAPFLFGRDLWAETRVPLFEQAVDCGDAAARVTFGSAYLDADCCAPFRENVERFAPLLPLLDDAPPEALAHLRLHNGTIWRWNRLLAGRDAGSRPHLRIEHRVMAAGPTILDMIANAALYVGAAHELASAPRGPETWLPFGAARDNFYRAARNGLDAELAWHGRSPVKAHALLHDELVPLASAGLARLGIGEAERDRYLDIVAARARNRQNGTAWQRAHAERHGRDFLRLVAEYLEHQRSGMPVHEWDA